MARQRVIVGIGEALLCEFPDRVEPGGLTIRCARQAARLGHRGIPISRLGQDLAANELLTQIKAAELPIDHLQSDPDLPTGRLIVRSIGGTTRRTLQPRAAFDNLQWDFDLVDVAQSADGVVFGALAQRDGQSQSIIRRFVAECVNAVRVFDLTNRPENGFDRVQARATLEYADGVVADDAALRLLVPSWDGRQSSDAAAELLRSHQLGFVITIQPGDCSEKMTAHLAAQTFAGPRKFPAAQHDAAVVGFLHGMLSGWDTDRSLELACAGAEYAASHPNDAIPGDLL